MYDPIRKKGHKIDDDNQQNEEGGNNRVHYPSDPHDQRHAFTESQSGMNSDPWIDEDDRVKNFYVTTNALYDKIRLPKTIKISNPEHG